MSSTPLLVVQKGSSEHRQWQALNGIIIAGLILLTPLVLEPFEIGKMNRALVLSIAILAVNLVVGFNGMLALGHSAFMGLGAFFTASMVQDEHWDYWMVIIPVVIVGFLVGLVVGLPALRVKGLYLALVTIAMAVVFPTLVNIEELGIAARTGGPNGKNVSEEVEAPGFMEWLPGVDGARGGAAYRFWIIALMVGVIMLLIRNYIRSRPGRAVIAIRDNEAGAAVYGVNLPLYKTVNFGISAALGTMAGLMWSLDKSFVAGQDFTFLLAIDLIIGLVIGGVGTLQGSLLGGLFVVWARDLTKRISIPLGFYTLDGNGPLANAIFGLILILFTFFAPGGMVSLARMVNAKFIRVVPNRPDGSPIAPLESLDPGHESTRAQAAMKLILVGVVLFPIGWLMMNIDNLLVGVLAFVLRLQLLITAPVAYLVGRNELAALKAGRRPQSISGTANVAMILGAVGTLLMFVLGLLMFIDQYGSADFPLV
jgi:branched-chain amino acid transport system permease protein